MQKSIGRRCILKNKFLDLFKNFAENIKTNRKLQIGLAILFGILLICCYFLFIHSPSDSNNSNSDNDNTNISLSAAEAYANSLENKLAKILSQVKGAGEVSVLVTLGSGFEYVYATEETIKETSSGSTTTNTIVLVSGEPVLVKEVYPEISGVLVSATGADNISVKLNLVTAIQTVIDVANEDITILTRV